MVPSSRDRRPWRRRPIVALAAALAALALVASCTSGGSTASGGDDPPAGQGTGADEAGPPGTYPTVSLSALDERLHELVGDVGLGGAALVVDQDGSTLHVHTEGDVGTATPLPLAETGTWLAAATLMSLVEDGSVGLDRPVGDVLPWMTADHAAITLRQLLSHTSGLPRSVDCTTPEGCDTAVAAAPLATRPGEAFAVSAAGYHVAARLAEAVTGRPWGDLVRERLLDPLGMAATSSAVPLPSELAGPDPTTTSPAAPGAGLLATGGTTTVEDVGRFLAMLRNGGAGPNGPVLAAASIEEMERDQTAAIGTAGEPWVAATGVPTYGLGVWRDRLRGDDSRLASAVSAPNRFGVYPVLDRTRNMWAVVAVVDPAAPGLAAVEESARIVQLVPVGVDTDGRPVRRPGSPLGG